MDTKKEIREKLGGYVNNILFKKDCGISLKEGDCFIYDYDKAQNRLVPRKIPPEFPQGEFADRWKVMAENEECYFLHYV